MTTKPPPRSIGQAALHRARSHRSAALGKKPPLCSIGQEATAAQHRARSHCHAASGKKPPPRGAASGKKPLPRRIGQEATAAQHRARSHRRAASGKKPPPPLRRIGQEATAAPPLRLAAFDPRTHDFHVHPEHGTARLARPGCYCAGHHDGLARCPAQTRITSRLSHGTN